MKPHQHSDLIKAWADGAEIQYRSGFTTEWTDVRCPSWGPSCEYRIKPEPKPDRVYYTEVHPLDLFSKLFDNQKPNHNLKLTFDGETDELKKAEVI